jgi:hypothetical protein
LSGRVETQKTPAGDLPGRGSLIELCESPGRAVVKPQSGKWGSGTGSNSDWFELCTELEKLKWLTGL